METIKVGNYDVEVFPAAVKEPGQKLAEITASSVIDTLTKGHINPYDIVLLFVGCDGFDYFKGSNLATMFNQLIHLKLADSKKGTDPKVKLGTYVSASDEIVKRPVTFFAIYVTKKNGEQVDLELVKNFCQKMSVVSAGRKMLVPLNTIHPSALRSKFVDVLVEYLPEATLWTSNAMRDKTTAAPYNRVGS